MDLLKRQLAPILPDAWALVDAEAKRVLELYLAGRKIVDFDGPYGWTFAAVSTGRLDLFDDKPDPDVKMGVRRVQPVVELRIPIRLSQMELDTVSRGAKDPDLSAVVRGAEKIALAEDGAMFHGLPRAGIPGILPSSPHAPLPLPSDVRELPRTIVAAKEVLRRAGISGPFALLLGPSLYDQVFATSEEGHPVAKRIEQLLVDRPIVLASALEGGALVSVRGGDYELTVGQDLAIGYAHHTKDEVELYITESFTFRVLEPAAAVALGTK
jgi:uncharacterized linocin/CFP29 family protein